VLAEDLFNANSPLPGNTSFAFDGNGDDVRLSAADGMLCGFLSSVPAGTTDSSPAIYRWERRRPEYRRNTKVAK